MNALILNNGRLALRPYHQWLRDAGYAGRLVLLASQEQLARFGEQLPPEYDHAESIAGYETSGEVEARAIELGRQWGVTRIIACQEQDLERAAALREILGIAGQDVRSAAAFRDKLLMKDLAQAAGIGVTAYACLQTPADLLAFARAHGLPVVVKPRDGSSSKGLSILRDPAALEDFLVTFDWDGGVQPNHLMEAFVRGPMYHIDGLVAGGRVVAAWPSGYQYELAAFDDTGPRLDVTLDPGDPLTARLLSFTGRILAALPTPRDTTFHAEVFHTPADELLLCEIASRNGGAWIKECHRAMFGFDLPTARVLAQLGLPLPFDTSGGPLQPAQMAGQLLLLKRPGRVVSVPAQAPFPWVVRYRPFVKAGDVMHKARSSGDFMAALVASAPTREACETRLREASEWFLASAVIEPVHSEE
jgi:L-amino acid ligase C-terminal domain 2